MDVRRSLRLSALLTATVVATAPDRGLAALPIELEVAVAQSAPFGAMQDWGKLLSEMDLARVRLRGATGGDEPSITPTGDGDSRRFRVVGVINNRDQLTLPGGTFGQGDRAKLKAFFESLPEQVAERGVERGIFGLTKPDFEKVYEELSAEVDVSTKGMAPQAAFSAITAGLTVPIEIDPQAKGPLARAEPLAAELKGLSTGTAVAIVLRPANLTLLPQQLPGKPLILRVAPATAELRGWPAGWKPAKVDRQIVPEMYRFTNIEITGFTLDKALEGLVPHMGVPMLFDERVLATREIDPAAIAVELPRGKTYIRRAVDRILSQARLAGELRADEQGTPFYWITQFGPDNPPARGVHARREPSRNNR